MGVTNLIIGSARDDRNPDKFPARPRLPARVVESAGGKALTVCGPAPSPVSVPALEEQLASMDEGLSFPWPALTKLCRVDPGGMTVIGAATSHGKTTFALNLLVSWLEAGRGSVVFWSGEMAPCILYARILGLMGGVPFGEVTKSFREGLFSGPLLEAQKKFRDYAGNLYILEEPVSAEEFSAYCARVAAKESLAAVFVDYLQQMPPGGASGRTREEEVSLTCQRLRVMARDLRVPVIAMSQLSRGNQDYSEKPLLSHFRESGRIEQEAQAALGLWNSEMARVRGSAVPLAPPEGWYWAADDDATAGALAMAESHGKVLLEVSILKNRLRGNVGRAVPLLLDGATGRLEPLPSVPGFQELAQQQRVISRRVNHSPLKREACGNKSHKPRVD